MGNFNTAVGVVFIQRNSCRHMLTDGILQLREAIRNCLFVR